MPSMAAAFSTHPLSFAPRPLFSPTPPKPVKTLTLALPSTQNPSGRSTSAPTALFASQLPRRSFRAAQKVAETDPKAINGDEENQTPENKSEDKEDKKDIPAMKMLIQAYKKAIIDGDEKSVCEMEVALCAAENEKNDLSAKCTEIAAEIASGRDRLLRLKADFDNFRKKFEKDCLNFTSDIQEEVFQSLLPMVDSFEQAKQKMKPETDKEKKIDASYQGIYKQFVEIMRSFRVSVVETIGKPFDPAIHEAVAREESPLFKAGIVSQEIRRGFFLGDRLHHRLWCSKNSFRY
ncbi:protein GrpE [Phoenix dactylifera]|uniref:Protein GrpE n=1 Tax=Phoenix dactylifera TaxID=42345 RepID=A0A8B8J1N6_PHODC|nr:protein GrpE [Phoenix dactylifera]